MKCPICGSESSTTLKSKKITSKRKEVNELLLQCNECNSVYRSSFTENTPHSYRLIISEHDISKKTFIDLYPDETIAIGNILLSDIGQAEVTSLETRNGKRVEKALVKDVSTIWASSMEVDARLGVSVDLSGTVKSYKIEIDRDFKFEVDDIVKIEDYIFRIKTIKTLERKTKKGFAKASVIKRVYGRPVNLSTYDYDLTNKIISKKKLLNE